MSEGTVTISISEHDRLRFIEENQEKFNICNKYYYSDGMAHNSYEYEGKDELIKQLVEDLEYREKQIDNLYKELKKDIIPISLPSPIIKTSLRSRIKFLFTGKITI